MKSSLHFESQESHKNLKNCRFISDSVDYNGHIFNPERLKSTTHTRKASKMAPHYQRFSATFLPGLHNVYRRFIPYFKGIAHPLNKLRRKWATQKFQLDEEQLESFNTFIGKICSPPILTLLCPYLPYAVDTDASTYGIYFKMFQTHE